MNFGQAIEEMKAGKCVQRAGWNGKGMYIYIESLIVVVGEPPTFRKFEPCFIMYTAQKTHQPGWLASQADMLSDDWSVVTP